MRKRHARRREQLMLEREALAFREGRKRGRDSRDRKREQVKRERDRYETALRKIEGALCYIVELLEDDASPDSVQADAAHREQTVESSLLGRTDG